MSRKPILCLDFDGVIHSYTSKWEGAHVIPDPPVNGALVALLGYAKDYEVSIFSSRSKSLRGRRAMKKWLMQNLYEYFLTRPFEEYLQYVDNPFDQDDDRLAKEAARDFVKCDLSWPWFKPPASVSIDDRALTFDGTWPEVGALKSFKPWNKK
ncbi:MAG: hypothetical protein ACR2RE_00265 [Geminicoccaceae bacterium]